MHAGHIGMGRFEPVSASTSTERSLEEPKLSSSTTGCAPSQKISPENLEKSEETK